MRRDAPPGSDFDEVRLWIEVVSAEGWRHARYEVASARLASDGTARFAGVPPGRYQLWLQGGNGPWTSLSVHFAGDAPCTVTWPPR